MFPLRTATGRFDSIRVPVKSTPKKLASPRKPWPRLSWIWKGTLGWAVVPGGGICRLAVGVIVTVVPSKGATTRNSGRSALLMDEPW